MDGDGDFWGGGSSEGASLFFSVSGVSKLLEEETPSLTALLDEADIIQEAHAQSKKLMAL